MFLKFLSVFCFILVGLTSIRCDRSGIEESPGRSSRFLLSTAKECARECDKRESPKICYYRFNLELYPTLGKACELCTPNNTNSIQSSCQCITANGVEKIILAANRMLPGPSIQVCAGDRIVVDVRNNMKGLETSIHWHGVHQKGSPYYDGVPLITQCPISDGQIFRYQFIAENPGTHYWSSQSGMQQIDGLYGSLIIRTPLDRDPSSSLYKNDLPEHIIILSDFMNTQSTERFPGTMKNNPAQHPDSLLINGKGQFRNPITGSMTTSPSEEFTIAKGGSYRFRMINIFSTVCFAELTIQGHTMTVISADGTPVRPRNVSTIISHPGERYDFVINADQHPDAYWIQLRALGPCSNSKTQQTAILRYEGITGQPKSQEPTYDKGLPKKIILNPSDGNFTLKRSNALRLTDLKSALPVDEKIINKKPALNLVVEANFVAYPANVLYQPNTYNPFLSVTNNRTVVATLNGASFIYPSTPPLLYNDDISIFTFCNAENPPTDCRIACGCTIVHDIPLGQVIEIIIVDGRALAGLMLPFHIHGYSFKVIGMGSASDLNVKKLSAKYISDLNLKGLLNKNYNLPIYKDTIAVPTNGYVILELYADNPGYWMMQNQIVFQSVIGSSLVFRVGKSSDLPPVPSGFPVCKNFIPSIASPER